MCSWMVFRRTFDDDIGIWNLLDDDDGIDFFTSSHGTNRLTWTKEKFSRKKGCLVSIFVSLERKCVANIMATFTNSVWENYEKQISSRFQPLLWLMSLRCFSPMEEKICLNIVVWQVHFGQFMQKIKAFHEKFTEWTISLHLRKFGSLDHFRSVMS